MSMMMNTVHRVIDYGYGGPVGNFRRLPINDRGVRRPSEIIADHKNWVIRYPYGIENFAGIPKYGDRPHEGNLFDAVLDMQRQSPELEQSITADLANTIQRTLDAGGSAILYHGHARPNMLNRVALAAEFYARHFPPGTLHAVDASAGLDDMKANRIMEQAMGRGCLIHEAIPTYDMWYWPRAYAEARVLFQDLERVKAGVPEGRRIYVDISRAKCEEDVTKFGGGHFDNGVKLLLRAGYDVGLRGHHLEPDHALYVGDDIREGVML